MLSDRNKRLAGNLGRSAFNYLVVFVVIVLGMSSIISAWCASWQDFVKLMFMDRDSLDFSVLKWTYATWLAAMVCAHWFFLNFAIRAYKRQKEIKWE
jgi:hypothetical protein